MPYICLKSWYPPSKTDEVVKVYLEVIKKYPPENQTLLKTVLPVASKVTKDGIETIEVYDVDNDKLSEAILYTATVMTEFRNIDNYFYEISTLSKTEESLGTLGIKL